jgi:hypothetical protein
MTGAPSALSLAAAGMYMIVVTAVVLACVRAIALQQVPWHKFAWGAIAALFLGLVLMRIFSVEELVRSELRGKLYTEGVYENRRSLQAPLFVFVFAMATVIAGGLFNFVARGVRGRRNIAAIIAIGCTGGMLFLLALRLVSLHSVDELLYGTFKLNWVADLGLSLIVLGCAVRYVRVVGGGPSGRSASPPRSQR